MQWPLRSGSACPIYIAEDILEKAQLTNSPSDTELASANENDNKYEPNGKI